MKAARPKSPALLAALGSLLIAGVCAADDDLIKVSQDPFTDPNAQHRTEVEPVMVAHENTLVTAMQVGRFFGAGADTIGWATSKDGGRTWQHGFLQGLTNVVGGSWSAVSLPVAAYDRKHDTYLIASQPFDADGNGRGVYVNRSPDGLHWSAPVVAATSEPTYGGVNGHFFACDNVEWSPFYGNCYDAYLDLTSPIGNFNDLIVSHDGGVTWSAPIQSPDSTLGLPSSMVIQPNGNVFVFGRNAGPNGDQMSVIRSADGGVSLQNSVYITTQQFDYPYLRSDPDPEAAVDPSGKLYVVFPDCRFRAGCGTSAYPPNDMVMTTSRDGVHWSEITRIPIDAVTGTTDHVVPGFGLTTALGEFGADLLAGVPQGPPQLVVTYYTIDESPTCTVCDVTAGSITSEDGGRTWNRARKIGSTMQQSWLAQTFAGPMVSDLLTVVFMHGRPWGSFALARTPDPNSGLLDEAIYLTPLDE